MKIGFLPALALLLIGLKLGHVIAWSWFFVLAPLWLMAPLLIIAVVFLLVVAIANEAAKKPTRRRW